MVGKATITVAMSAIAGAVIGGVLAWSVVANSVPSPFAVEANTVELLISALASPDGRSRDPEEVDRMVAQALASSLFLAMTHSRDASEEQRARLDRSIA